MNKEFSAYKTVAEIESYLDKSFIKGKEYKKVFYNYKEWSGWRFYLKAIKLRDWKSIWGHIKNHD